MRSKTLVALLLVFSCGGRVEPDRGALTVDPATASRDSTIGVAAWVPDGIARLGDWLALSDLRFEPSTWYYGTPNKLVTYVVAVKGYHLMVEEVTSGAYQRCVQDRGCDPGVPSVADDLLPAAANYFQARAFCRAYGGDLPTPAQWMRAAQGPTPDVMGLGSFTLAYADCVQDPGAHAECAEYAKLKRDWLADPRGGYVLEHGGSRAWDVGPYGHRDLAVNANEWLRHVTVPDRSPNQQFSDADLVADISPDALPIFGPSHVSLLVDVVYVENVGQTTNAFEEGFRNDGPNFSAPYTGFRCAFP